MRATAHRQLNEIIRRKRGGGEEFYLLEPSRVSEPTMFSKSKATTYMHFAIESTVSIVLHPGIVPALETSPSSDGASKVPLFQQEQ